MNPLVAVDLRFCRASGVRVGEFVGVVPWGLICRGLCIEGWCRSPVRTGKTRSLACESGVGCWRLCCSPCLCEPDTRGGL